MTEVALSWVKMQNVGASSGANENGEDDALRAAANLLIGAQAGERFMLQSVRPLASPANHTLSRLIMLPINYPHP